MARRIDRYTIKPGVDLGDPDVLTKIFEDIDNRLHVQELNDQAIDERADELERVALSRLDDVFTGVLRNAQGKLQDTGAWFKAESQTTFIPEIGAQQFILTEATRGGYVSTQDILIVSASDETHLMVAKLVSYVPIDGVLAVTISEAFGDTEKSDWLIYPLSPGYADHLGRVDNPHNVTAEQLGLGDVDNTPDADKPISTAQQGAFDQKADLTHVNAEDSIRVLKSGDVMSGALTAEGLKSYAPTGTAMVNAHAANGRNWALESFANDDVADPNCISISEPGVARRLIIDPSGRVRIPNQPAMSCARNVGWETFGAGVHYGLLGGFELNRGGFYSGGSAPGGGLYVHVPVSGWYLVTMRLYVAANEYGRVYFAVNGAPSALFHHLNQSSLDRTEETTTLLALTAGDYLAMYADQNMSIYTGAAHTSVTAIFLG